MKVGVVGVGYVGLVVGSCLSKLGNRVICVDIDTKKIQNLNKGILPIYEPGLKEIVETNIKEKRLLFTTNLKDCVTNSDIIFIAVGTPQGEDNKADLSYVTAAAKDIGKYINSYKVIVIKSTVPVGESERIKKIIMENQTKRIPFDVVSNPEFLREGSAVNDFLEPSRIIIGTESEKAKEIMLSLYKPLESKNKHILVVDNRSAELIKYASNAFLATKISFINELSRLAEKTKADIKSIAKGMGLDPRIGPKFLRAGVGYGGSCFPKDIRALIQIMREHDCSTHILDAVEKVNEEQRFLLVEKVKSLFESLNGKKIAIWGLSFKPNTDDMREAPAITIIKELQKEGALIRAFDPIAIKEAEKIFSNIEYGENPYDTIKGCDALVIVTEWGVFRKLDKKKIRELLKEPNIIDGRNIYEPKEMEKLGFNYICIGR